MRGDLRAFRRYARGLRSFLRQPFSPEECRQQIRDRLAARESNLELIFERGVYAQPRSPYRKLLEHAGIEFGDVRQLIGAEGAEGALERLYDAGVHVTYEEFKGRRPIERPGLSWRAAAADFDNPLFTPAYLAKNIGSSGVERRVMLDFDHLVLGATYDSLISDLLGMRDRAFSIWLPVPPALIGLANVIRHAKLGKPVERWFSQNPLSLTGGSAKDYLLTRFTIVACRLGRIPFPAPEHVPLAAAHRVARWLAVKVSAGTPTGFSAGSPSSAVRVCLAAKEHGLDIAGTVFRLTGEPFTREKAQILADAGCRAGSIYSMTELGLAGAPCAAPAEPDEVHLAADKLAVIQRDRRVGPAGPNVGALHLTTLHPSGPKLLINVESDDYGVLSSRRCGCLAEELGLSRHLHGIRSYDKLTSEGTTFLGSDLLTLVERTLPGRFGGAPTDYQIVEDEEAGISKVSIVVSPRIGEVDEADVVAAVLEVARTGPAYKRMMGDRWRDGDTLRVIRREPYSTASAKILPLHLVRR